jgi:hypothetical protein
VADGKGRHLHRVSRRLFDPTTMCRQELDAYLQSPGSALEEYFTAYSMLQEYALVSLVERRIEQVHSVIKRTGATMTFALPPYICARLREGMHLERLATGREFHDMCVAQWRSRTLLNKLLEQRIPNAQLETMTNVNKVKFVYQCDLQSEFQSTTLARRTQVAWLALTRPVAQDLDKAVQICVSYWKSTLVVGGYYSLPVDLFQTAAESSGGGGTADMDPVGEAIDAVAAPTCQLEWTSDKSICVFQVLSVHPEWRAHIKIPHATPFGTRIHVSVCTMVDSNPGKETCIVFNDADVHQALDVHVLVDHMGQALRQCFRWNIVGHKASVKPRQGQVAQVLDCDSYELPSVVGMPQQASASSQEIVPCQPARHTANEHRILAELLRKKAFLVGGNGPAMVMDLAHYDVEAADLLQKHGAVFHEKNEFGEVSVALHLSAVSWSVMYGLRSPTQHLRLIPHEMPAKSSKLQVLFKLQMEGWLPMVGVHGSWSPGAPLHCRADFMKRPASYFLALLRQDAVVAKGVAMISHDQCDGYYKCLLHMPPEPLLAVLDCMENESNAWFESKLQDYHRAELDEGDEGDVALPLPEAAAVMLGVGPPSELLDDEMLLPSVVASSVRRRAIVDLGEGTPIIRVFFDNFTGGSVHQRGFVDCPHHGCIKYKLVYDESMSRYCAWMYLWLRHGIEHPDIDRATHLQWEPRVEDVDAAETTIRTVPF